MYFTKNNFDCFYISLIHYLCFLLSHQLKLTVTLPHKMYLAVDLLTNRPFLDILSFSCHISLRSELLFNNLTKRLFINSYTSRNQLYTILPPHQTTFHQLVHLTKSIVYHSTTSPNDYSSISTPHEINCRPFYYLTKRFSSIFCLTKLIADHTTF